MILLAMAMFVLVVDTSMMNVSISAVVDDLGVTVSEIQSAIALEALVSAAFILIGSKVADLIGRKRASYSWSSWLCNRGDSQRH
jgi:MFS family permease